MPNKIEKLPDGKIHAELETGEIFEGEPLEITQKMADAHVSTKRWGQGFKQQLEQQQSSNNGNGHQQQPTVDPQEAQLQSYLLTQTAKALGYESADQFKNDLQRVKGTTDEVQNQIVASNFLAAAPDFPNTPEAIDALSKKVDAMGWGFDTQSMLAAHALLAREHATDPTKGYAPLTQEQINQTWASEMQAASRLAPPPIIQSKSPDGNQQGFNPWDTKAVPLEQLRAAAIRQELEGRK